MKKTHEALERYNAAYKEGDKYIIIGETAPLALMFVAAEEVFRVFLSIHIILLKKLGKNVVIVSRDTIFGFKNI